MNQVVLQQDNDPSFVELLRCHLADHDADPRSGARWENLRDRLLKGGMPEILWKQGAENDLLQVSSEFEKRDEGSGDRFVEQLDFTLASPRRHPEMAPLFDPPMRRLLIGSTGFGLFYKDRSRERF